MKDYVRDVILAHKDELLGLSHKIHGSPEIAFQEKQAASWLKEALHGSGFELETGLCGLETSFRARANGGEMRVVVCAEYDALPGIGHACGHNVIAAAAVGAAIGLKPVVAELGLDLHVMGTPAEEEGGGKIRLLEGGAFEGAHAAIMIHPSPHNLLEPTVIGVDWIDVRFYGVASHASASPENGINAADAVVLAHTAIGLLRQHISQGSRVHGIITNCGDAANIIPAVAEATYMVRAATLDELDILRTRVEKCFEAAALATGCDLEIAPRRTPYAPMHHDSRLTRLVAENASAMGREFRDTDEVGRRWAASTDMGNVSQRIPSAQPMLSIGSYPATNHQPEFAEATITEEGDQAVLDGATLMAWTIVDAASGGAVRNSLLQDD